MGEEAEDDRNRSMGKEMGMRFDVGISQSQAFLAALALLGLVLPLFLSLYVVSFPPR